MVANCMADANESKTLVDQTFFSFSIIGQSTGSYHFFNITFRPDERAIKAEFRWFRHTRPLMGRHHFYKVSLHILNVC